jgi:Domain of unknown function (DUF5122) beta-propeller
VVTPFGPQSDAGAAAVTLERNGKIVAAGSSGTDFAVVRYRRDGILDSGFGKGGKVVTDFTPSAGAGRATVR